MASRGHSSQEDRKTPPRILPPIVPQDAGAPHAAPRPDPQARHPARVPPPDPRTTAPPATASSVGGFPPARSPHGSPSSAFTAPPRIGSSYPALLTPADLGPAVPAGAAAPAPRLRPRVDSRRMASIGAAVPASAAYAHPPQSSAPPPTERRMHATTPSTWSTSPAWPSVPGYPSTAGMSSVPAYHRTQQPPYGLGPGGPAYPHGANAPMSARPSVPGHPLTTGMPPVPSHCQTQPPPYGYGPGGPAYPHEAGASFAAQSPVLGYPSTVGMPFVPSYYRTYPPPHGYGPGGPAHPHGANTPTSSSMQVLNYYSMHGSDARDYPHPRLSGPPHLAQHGHDGNRDYGPRRHHNGHRGNAARTGRPYNPRLMGPMGANLFVFHVPDQMTNNELYALFAPYGHLLSANIQTREGGRSKGFAFVNYASPTGAAAALCALQQHAVHGKHLSVEYKRDDSNQNHGGIF